MRDASASPPIDPAQAFALLAALSLALSANHAAAKFAVAAGASVEFLLVVRGVVAVLASGLLLSVSGGTAALRSLGASGTAAACLAGIAQACQALLLFHAVRSSTPALALAVFHAFPLLLGSVALLSPSARTRFAAIRLAWAAALWGCVMAAQAGPLADPRSSDGILLAAASAACWTACLVLVERRLGGTHPLARTWTILASGLAATFAWGAFTSPAGAAAIPIPTLTAAAFGWTAAVCVLYAGPTMALLHLAPRLRLSRTSPALGLEPVWAGIGAILLFGAPPNLWQAFFWTGAAACVAALFLLAVRRTDPP